MALSATLQAKIRPVKSSAAPSTFSPSLQAKIRPVFQFTPEEQKVERQRKLSRFQEEARQSEEEAESYKGFGFLGKIAENLPFVGAPIRQGKATGQQLATGKVANRLLDTQKQASDIQVNLLKSIREKKARGEDTHGLEIAYRHALEDTPNVENQLDKIVPGAKQTTGEALGNVAEMGLDILSVGSFKGIKSGGLKNPSTGVLTKARPTILPKKPARLFSKETVKDVTKAVPVGYASDVAAGLEGYRGEERTGTKAFIPGAGTVISVAAPVAIRAAESAVNTGKRLIFGKPVSEIVSSREKELEKLKNNYVDLRKASTYSKDAHKSTINRVASTDVLVGSVDENSVIRTTQPGGAAEQYRAQTIDGAESVVRDNLEKEGKMVDLKTVEKNLTRTVNESGLEGDDLISALRKVKREIAGYALKADKDGRIPLTLAHDAKISTTRGINFQTPPEVKTYRKSIARGLKETVEKESSTNVGEVNKELLKYYQDIDFLESLDGKRAKGGRMTRLFAGISGNIIGSATGGAIGGFPGAAIGGAVGGEVGSRIQQGVSRRTFGKATGAVAPKSKILQEAVTEAEKPRLALPAPKAGAYRSEVSSGGVIRLGKETQSSVDLRQMGTGVAPIDPERLSLQQMANEVTKRPRQYELTADDMKYLAGLDEKKRKAGLVKAYKEAYQSRIISEPRRYQKIAEPSNPPKTISNIASTLSQKAKKVNTPEITRYTENVVSKSDDGLVSKLKLTPPKVGSVEDLFEKAQGWIPGLKKAFDTAMKNKNSARVEELLPHVPQYYRELFAKSLKSITANITRYTQ